MKLLSLPLVLEAPPMKFAICTMNAYVTAIMSIGKNSIISQNPLISGPMFVNYCAIGLLCDAPLLTEPPLAAYWLRLEDADAKPVNALGATK